MIEHKCGADGRSGVDIPRVNRGAGFEIVAIDPIRGIGGLEDFRNLHFSHRIARGRAAPEHLPAFVVRGGQPEFTGFQFQAEFDRPYASWRDGEWHGFVGAGREGIVPCDGDEFELRPGGPCVYLAVQGYIPEGRVHVGHEVGQGFVVRRIGRQNRHGHAGRAVDGHFEGGVAGEPALLRSFEEFKQGRCLAYVACGGIFDVRREFGVNLAFENRIHAHHAKEGRAGHAGLDHLGFAFRRPRCFHDQSAPELGVAHEEAVVEMRQTDGPALDEIRVTIAEGVLGSGVARPEEPEREGRAGAVD